MIQQVGFLQCYRRARQRDPAGDSFCPCLATSGRKEHPTRYSSTRYDHTVQVRTHYSRFPKFTYIFISTKVETNMLSSDLKKEKKKKEEEEETLQ